MRNRQNIGFCNLCKNPQIKLVKSHIIPRSFYPQEISQLFSSKGSYPKRCPNGVYEYLFCEPCEQLFSPGDNYGEKVLKRHQWNTVSNSSTYKCIQYNENLLNYFVVSLLYRASKSKHSYFTSIQLGKYESLAEDYLLGKIQMPSELSYIILENIPEVGMLGPRRKRIEGVKTYVFYLNSYVIYIKVDKREWPRDVLYLKPNHNQFFTVPPLRNESTSLKAKVYIANQNIKYLQKC